MTTAMSEKLDVYKSHQHKSESDRDIDARALLICASQLAAARESQNDHAVYTAAVKRNQHLWTVFQVALCDPGNPLPLELKTILLNLSCYVDKISFRAIAEFKPTLLASLIDINRSIAAGLSKKPAAGNHAPATESRLPPGTPVMTTA